MGGTSVSSLVMDTSVGQKVTMAQTVGPLASYLEIGMSDITINSIDGTASIKVDGATGTIVLEAKTPVSGFPASTVTIDPSGMDINGVGLATNNLVDWILQNAAFFSMGPMGPNAISHPAMAVLSSMANMAVPLVPLGFKSKV